MTPWDIGLIVLIAAAVLAAALAGGSLEVRDNSRKLHISLRSILRILCGHRRCNRKRPE